MIWPCMLHGRHTVAGCPIARAAVAVYQKLLIGRAWVHAAARGAALPATVHVLHLPSAHMPGPLPDLGIEDHIKSMRILTGLI